MSEKISKKDNKTLHNTKRNEKMKLLFGADLVPTCVTEENYIKGDARTLFGKVCDLAANMDRVIINLECALTLRRSPAA